MKRTLLSPHDGFLLAIEAEGMTDLRAWCAANRAALEKDILQHGVVLFRGFDAGERTFGGIAQIIAPEAMNYEGGNSPRERVEGSVYMSTTFPPQYTLCQHFEMAYLPRWPLRLLFCCETPPTGGGETPVASSRALMKRLPPRIVETFAKKKVMYTRQLGKAFTRTWQEAFETNDRQVVEAYCRKLGIKVDWTNDDGVRLTHVAQGTAVHPQTGEVTWFNSAHFFHEAMDSIPNTGQHCYHGDGSPIDIEMLREVRAAFDEITITFPWKRGDLLVIDNMLATHGRNPFSGPRRILAWLASPYSPAHEPRS